MHLTLNNSTQPGRRQSPTTRRGVATGFLIVTLVFLAGFIALSLNTSRLLHTKAELRSVCQAAALAGAAELLEEGVLYGYPDPSDDVLMAREAARLMGKANRVNGREVDLDPNRNNAPLGDVVVGTIDPFGPVGQPIGLPVDPTRPAGVNTVRITARLSGNTYDKLSLMLGKLTGVMTSDTAAMAQATLDTRIAGFKPERGVRVPVVPLAAEYEPWLSQATAAAEAGVNDVYTVNMRTGEVSLGPDGIAEIVLASGATPPSGATSPTATKQDAEATEPAATTDDTTSETQPAWCVALDLVNDEQAANVWAVRCRDGLSAGDLRLLGGQLVVAGGTLIVPRTAQMPNDAAYGLMDVVGASRAWPLFEGYTDGDAPSCAIVGFAAARVVAVRPSSDTQNGNWEIVVQPTTLVSSQAVTDKSMNPNPWIGKLELTQ